MPPYLQSFIDTAFYAVITGAIVLLVNFLEKLIDKISELNTKIGIVIEKLTDHDSRIQRLEKKHDRE